MADKRINNNLQNNALTSQQNAIAAKFSPPQQPQSNLDASKFPVINPNYNNIGSPNQLNKNNYGGKPLGGGSTAAVEADAQGNVKYHVSGGNSYNLSKEEYQNLLGAQKLGANLTLDQINKMSGVSDKTKQILQEEAQARGQLPSNQTLASINDIGNAVPSNANLPSGEVNPVALGATGATIGLAGAGALAAGTATAGLGFAALGVGALVKIGYEARQDVKQSNKVFTASKQNIQTILNSVNSGAMSASDAVDAYNQELANINAAEALLKWETRNSLASFVSNGGDELAAVEAYKRTLPQKEALLRQAILNPNLNSVQSQFDALSIETQ